MALFGLLFSSLLPHSRRFGSYTSRSSSEDIVLEEAHVFILQCIILGKNASCILVNTVFLYRYSVSCSSFTGICVEDRTLYSYFLIDYFALPLPGRKLAGYWPGKPVYLFLVIISFHFASSSQIFAIASWSPVDSFGGHEV